MPSKKHAKIFFFLFNRCYLLYLLAAAIFLLSFDKRALTFKRLDFLNESPSELIRIALQQNDPPNPQKLNDALTYYREIVELFPDSASGQAAVGFCYYYLKDDTQAAHYYQKAVALQDNLFGFYYNLGVIHFRMGKLDEAKKYFRQAVAIPPQESIKARVIDPFTQGRNIPLGLKQGYAVASKFILSGKQNTDTIDPETLPPGLFFYAPTFPLPQEGKTHRLKM
ncbi:MAG: hypothetical protein A2Z88_00710 [Omnitrophica WOR_2 bacterium GWA2_47_8]|nr:MAG: hypothetical protein A2Z88_00710 [Omnitrophica WOR_2 bacterium GWA2_47_8]